MGRTLDFNIETRNINKAMMDYDQHRVQSTRI